MKQFYKSITVYTDKGDRFALIVYKSGKATTRRFDELSATAQNFIASAPYHFSRRNLLTGKCGTEYTF